MFFGVTTRGEAIELPEALRRLPNACKAIIDQFLQEAAEARATHRVTADQIAHFAERRAELGRERSNLTTRSFPEALPVDHPKVRQIDEDVAHCTDSIARLSPRAELHFAVVSNTNALIGLVEDYVGSLHGAITLAPERGAPMLLQDETFFDAIETRRRRNRELAANIRQYQVAPIPSDVALKAAIEKIDADAARGAPDADDAIEMIGKKAGAVRWPVRMIEQKVRVADGGGRIRIEVPDVIAILSHLLRDRMVASVTAAIKAVADDEAALTDDRRAQLIDEAKRDALAVQREEVALIRAAKASGVYVSYRPDTDPRAVLGLSDDMPPPANKEDRR